MSPAWRARTAFLTLPLIAHGLFSRFGFNPTDDGLILAGARRLLEGQVPHRDFVWVRPPLSLALHAPVVAWGGEYGFWISRGVVWLELAALAWIVAGLAARGAGIDRYGWSRIALAAAAFALGVHDFPIMAWHSIDALLLAAGGIALLAAEPPGGGKTVLGAFSCGAAALCRQNFALVAPVAIVLSGRWRRPAPWVAALAPGALYALYLSATGAWGDAAVQLGAHGAGASLDAGLTAFLRRPEVPAGLVAGLTAGLAGRRWPRTGAALAALVVAFAALLIPLAPGLFFERGSFLLFGAAAGLALTERAGLRWTAVVALTLAWSVAVSIGYNSPALGAGALAAALLAPLARCASGSGNVARVGLAGVVVVSLAAAGVGRARFVYRDDAPARLTASLAGALPGGSGILTNPTTRAFLDDLAAARELAGGRPCVVLPDGAGLWPFAVPANPLPVDWAQRIELGDPRLVARVDEALDRFRGRGVAIVQKVRASSLANGPRPLGEAYEVVEHVRATWRLVAETRYFLVFE